MRPLTAVNIMLSAMGLIAASMGNPAIPCIAIFSITLLCNVLADTVARREG